jgi:hypothetical protein
MTTRRHTPNLVLLSRIVGTLLILTGLGFVLLTAVAATSYAATVSGYLLAPLVMLSFGAFLVWIGYAFLKPEPAGQTGARQRLEVNRPLIKYRPIIELVTATGCGLMLGRAVILCTGRNWLSVGMLQLLMAIAVCAGLLARGILVPFQSGLFTNDVWSHWPPVTRFLVTAILRIDWTGYLAVFFLFFDVEAKLQSPWGRMADVIASSLVSLLFASQFLALHFGQTRQPEPIHKPEP